MQKNKYRVLDSTLFEIASSRSFTEKDNLAEKFNEEGRIILVKGRCEEVLTLSIVKTETGQGYLVTWDDSEEYFSGWNMAWEEFMWCLNIAAPSAD